MDIYQFIDSKDIRNYLQDMKYKFTVPETAFLIYMTQVPYSIYCTAEEPAGAFL